MEQRLTVVTLGVSDLARSRAFYEALGWTTGAAPDDDVVFFQSGGMVVALWGRSQLAEDSGVTEGRGLGRRHACAQRRLGLGEVDAVSPRPPAQARRSHAPGAATFWGGYSGVFLDPDGHPWEVAHNPHWQLGEDGSVALNPDV